MRKNMPYTVLDITKKPGDPNAVKTGEMLLAENTKMREALVKCREIALQWQADEAAGVAGTTDKPHARSAAEAVIDMEFEINAALGAPEKEGGGEK